MLFKNQFSRHFIPESKESLKETKFIVFVENRKK